MLSEKLVADTVTWLMTGTRGQVFIDEIFYDLCNRLVVNGLPLARASLHFRTHHPQWLGSRMIWLADSPKVEVETVGYQVEETEAFLRSPFHSIITGASGIRKRLNTAASPNEFSLYDQLRGEGYTDYLAWPLDHTLGKRHLVTCASKAPRGFSDQDVTLLESMLPALSLVSEIRLKNQLARTLLNTYVGPHACQQILDGATTRGKGATVHAAILVCDLRNFTAISSSHTRDEVIEYLNSYFDAMAGPIERHGGEILKFMGDGLLAVFPLSNPDACADLLNALREAEKAIDELPDVGTLGRPGYGMGVHVGDVMYGNIGSLTRLDFTVIGPAVNIASRLESLTKIVNRRVLLSKDFVDLAECQELVEDMGSFQVRGLEEPIAVYAM